MNEEKDKETIFGRKILKGEGKGDRGEGGHGESTETLLPRSARLLFPSPEDTLLH